ncbi:hypothetical protein B0F90DRAFT_806449 [Multifurca ochricompacta]|uniref:Uncharacterized protein n=1 Tax=Multifurca ochricompacta TaxID=376703 RepID=A0AAD4MAT9_9AGAM|nr:hypothetical protein B0F90DRAFT_806449 [Multifurca ochricompacta]
MTSVPVPQPPTIALVPPTPERLQTEKAASEPTLPNFFANSQIFARTGVTPPQSVSKPVLQPPAGPDSQTATIIESVTAAEPPATSTTLSLQTPSLEPQVSAPAQPTSLLRPHSLPPFRRLNRRQRHPSIHPTAVHFRLASHLLLPRNRRTRKLMLTPLHLSPCSAVRLPHSMALGRPWHQCGVQKWQPNRRGLHRRHSPLQRHQFLVQQGVRSP